ncbi:MAG: tetratricopeptide repeat-containing protein, partial [Chloroflexaceae bacterium]
PPTLPVAPAPLPLGTVVDYDGWSVTLLRPDYAVTLDGAIGDLRPSGRFVLAIVAVSNNQPQPRRLPPDFFLVRDAGGRGYAPVPGASSAYLALYERAQRGDLALEDEFAPNSGMRSVPLLFDVPSDAGGLALLVPGAGPAGWPIGEPAPPVTSGP